MSTRTSVGLGIVALTSLAALVSIQSWSPSTPAAPELDRLADPLASPPPPTPGPHGGLEEFLDTKKDQKARRKQWFREMHRAVPGVDWQAVEAENGRAQQARRNAMSRGEWPPPIHDPGTWVERGSDNQAGRMHVARVAPDGETLYAGSSLGGVWRGTLDGEDWTPIGDNLYGGAHWLEILDTGDGDRVFASTDGGSIHYSDDDGATWIEPTGLDGVNSVRRLLMLSDGSQTLFLFGGGDGQKLYRSTDLGESFEVLVETSPFKGDAWADRTGLSDLYLMTADGLEHSADLGETWTLLGNPVQGAGRAELTASEAGAFYAVMDGTLYRSSDGQSWELKQGLSDYWSALNASSTDPDLFVYGGVETWISRDGGGSFAKKNNWWDYYTVYGGDEDTKLHADIMGIDVHVEADGETWYINTDGGLYESLDGLQSVHNLSLDGLRVSQYYDVHTSWADPDHVIAGAQDQGYQVTAWSSQDSDEALEFYQLVSGDYGHITSSDDSHEFVYSVYPGYLLVQIGEDEPTTEGAYFPDGESYVPWLPPIVADPNNSKAVFFPATKIYRAHRSEGWSWVQHSEDLSLKDGEYISAFAFSPVDSERAYLATSNGRIFTSTDGAVNWTKSQSLGPDDNWYYGQAIAPSWTDPDVITLGGSGYGVPAVYRSTDGGYSFQPWHEGLPDTLVYSLVEAMDGSGCVFAGTASSAYERCPEDEAWEDITDTSAPTTIFWSAHMLPHENTVRFGTYGRGIWDYQLETPDCYPVEDADGDGSWCHEDCDESDASVFPGAEEIADDGVDQDCDGQDLQSPQDSDPPATDDSDPSVAPPVVEPDPKCGCSASPAAGSVLGLLALLGLALTRRKR